jgi:hypothetical protein
MVWKPGTPLPVVPAGYKLIAWPPDQVLRHVKVGHNVPTVAISAVDAHQPSTFRALENSAGLVNLELIPDIPGCIPTGMTFIKKLGSAPGNVMQSYSTISGVTQTFTYGEGQSSSFGVGYSVSGNAGTFSAVGTASVSTDGVQGFAPQRGRSYNHFETYFEIGKYKSFNSCPQLDRYVAKPYQWNAGTRYVHPRSAPSARYCTPEHPGDSFTKSTTAAATFSVGYTAPVVNFSGTAQTGYSQTASIKFNYSRTGHLCGTANTPPNNPGVLVARS